VNWFSANYQWVVGVVAMPIILLLLKRWTDTANKRPVTGTMRAAPTVEGSSVIGGSGNNQNINAPVFNLNIGQPAPASERAGVVHGESPVAEPPKANITFCGPNITAIQESWNGGGVFFQKDDGHVAAVVQFSNDAVMGAKNKEAVVKAAIIYQDGAKELQRVTGCWLEQPSGEVQFKVYDSHKLIVGFMQGGEFCVLGKREIPAHRRRDWGTYLHCLGEMPKITALVRLTGVSSGHCYFEGQFEVTMNPLSISTAQAA
jgi:hypothetical protein